MYPPPQNWYCPRCGHSNQGNWNACQQCRTHNPLIAQMPPKKTGSKVFLVMILIFVGFVGLCGFLGVVGNMKSTKNNTSSPGALADRSPISGVTMANYNRIQIGMSYSEVIGILGQAGTEMSSNEIAGSRTVLYQWKGEGFAANMNAMFQNGKLISKAQFGLD